MSTSYTPDRWVEIIVTKSGSEPVHKILAGWHGGYAGSDSWRINSGIVSRQDRGNYIDFVGESGSVYSCHKDSYGLTGLTGQVLAQLKEHVESRGDTIEVLDVPVA